VTIELALSDVPPTAGPPGQLALALMITTHVPTVLINEYVEIILERLELDWPTLAAPWQIQLEQTAGSGQAPNWRYNPDRGVVEISQLVGQCGSATTGPLTPYHCAVRLRLAEPGPLLQREELVGTARVRVAGTLLSGRQVAWMNSNGLRTCTNGNGALVHRETSVAAGFIARLGDLIDRRSTPLMQQWHFTGIPLAECARAAAAALRDIGYHVELPVFESASGDLEQAGFHLTAGRMVRLPGRAVYPLQLVVSGETRITGHMRRVMEEDALHTSMESEVTTVTVLAHGQTLGPSSALALDMNRLMILLKKRAGVAAAS
jgi:hypothetical protein